MAIPKGPPKRKLSKFEKLSQQAKAYIINDDWIKMTGLLRDLKPQEIKKLELYYAHLTSDSLNKYKMRDDINEYWIEIRLKIVRQKILAILQQRNPLPPKLTFKEISNQHYLKLWPKSEQDATKKLLSKPNVWPSKFNKNRLLVKRIQDWGEWLLDNYEIIASNQLLGKLGIRFVPPKKGESGLQAISDMIALINHANAKLLQICEKGPYAGPMPSPSHLQMQPKGCMSTLELWYEAFSKTKGRIATQMKAKIMADIKRKKRIANAR